MAPPGVATRRVLFEEKVEVDIYTGANRPIRRRGPVDPQREEMAHMMGGMPGGAFGGGGDDFGDGD